jgi:hypothetical protein
LGEALLNAARFRLGAMAGVGEDNNVDGVCWSWDILGRNIRFFAEEFFPKKISWESLSTATQQSLIFWAPKAKQYLECGVGSCSKQRSPPSSRKRVKILTLAPSQSHIRRMDLAYYRLQYLQYIWRWMQNKILGRLWPPHGCIRP